MVKVRPDEDAHVNSRKRSAAMVVFRTYKREPDACNQAIALLLKERLVRNGGDRTIAPDDTKERSVNDFRPTEKYTK